MLSGFASGSRGLRGEDREVESLIVLQGRLCVFQLPLGNPGIFFSRVPFPSDQEHASQWGATVAQDLLNLILFFAFY